MGDSSLRGPNTDTMAGDIVCVSVPPDGPYGIQLVADSDGQAAVVVSFETLPNGKFGPVQKHGGVHPGDVLFEINDNSLMNTKFDDAKKIILDRNTLKKVLKFMNSKEYYRRKRGGSVRVNPTDSKSNFLSTIKRTRFSEEGGKQFVEYEIACQMRIAATKVQKDLIYQWSVWKRYSEFSSLHGELRRSLGWQMDGIEFPSSYTFVFNKMSPEFVEQRRDELKDYWQKVISIDKVTDFQKHHCSFELKAFLDVESQTKKEVAATADTIQENSEGGEIASNVAAPARRGSTRVMSRRLSAKPGAFSAEAAKALASDTATSQSTAAAAFASTPTNHMAPQTATNVSSTSTVMTDNTPPVPPPRPSALVAAPTAAPTTAPAATKPTPAPVSAPTTAPPTQRPSGGDNLPPKPTGARANLLGSINALRKD